MPVPLPEVEYFLSSKYSWALLDGWTLSQLTDTSCCVFCVIPLPGPIAAVWARDTGPHWVSVERTLSLIFHFKTQIKTLPPIFNFSMLKLKVLFPGPLVIVPDGVHRQGSCHSRSSCDSVKVPETSAMWLYASSVHWSKVVALGTRTSIQKAPQRESVLSVYYNCTETTIWVQCPQMVKTTFIYFTKGESLRGETLSEIKWDDIIKLFFYLYFIAWELLSYL